MNTQPDRRRATRRRIIIRITVAVVTIAVWFQILFPIIAGYMRAGSDLVLPHRSFTQGHGYMPAGVIVDQTMLLTRDAPVREFHEPAPPYTNGLYSSLWRWSYKRRALNAGYSVELVETVHEEVGNL